MKSETDSEFDALKPEVNQIKSKVQIIMNAIKVVGDDLNKAEIRQDEVSQKFSSVINDAKSTLLTAIAKETTEQLPEISNFDDAMDLRDRAKSLLNRLGDTSGSHRRTIHMFFGKYSKVLKFELGLLNREVKHLNELIDRYIEMTSSLSECEESIMRISIASRENKEFAKKGEETKNELDMLKSMELEVVKKIDELKNTERFYEYKRNKKEVERVNNETSRILSEIDAAFSRISRPLSKFAYEVGLDKESNYLMQSVMENPLNLIQNAKEDQIIEILTKVREKVQQGRITVKNPSKDIENINGLVSNLHAYVDEYKKHDSKVQELSSKTSIVDKELDKIHTELDRVRSDITQKESALNDYRQKVEHTRSTINREIKRITERIDRTMGSKVRIVI
ncbi:MAG: hypothetical protein ACE5J2_02740 [Nitrososphaerales archaeon]